MFVVVKFPTKVHSRFGDQNALILHLKLRSPVYKINQLPCFFCCLIMRQLTALRQPFQPFKINRILVGGRDAEGFFYIKICRA